jgi:predicted oxidoreductase
MSSAQPHTLSCPASLTRRDGLTLSRIVAGMWRMQEWQLTAQQRLRLIEQCLELGVSSFDHADIYGDYGVEALFGEALALQPGLRSACSWSANAASSW